MIDVNEKKQKILSFLESNGPSLPVRIAKTIEMEPVFASAILSELLNEKKLKLSIMRVGASALYLIPGQEKKLEEHADNLKSIEKETYLKLKEEIVLSDESQEPSTRVALRNIRDFATPFKIENKIFWRYSFANDEEVKKALNPKKGEKKVEEEGEKKVEEVKKEVKKTEEVKKNNISKNKTEKEEVKSTEDGPKEGKNLIENIFEQKEEETSPYLEDLKGYLEKKNLKILEEIQSDKKEIVAKIEVQTNIGKISFLLIAKNKKSISKDEIKSAMQRANYYKMPCLYLARKEPTKNILKHVNEYKNLIKIDSY